MRRRLLQRVERQLRRCHHGGEELMKLKHAHTLKPLRFTVNTRTKKPAQGPAMNRSTEKISRNG